MDKHFKDCSLYNLQRRVEIVRAKSKSIKDTIDYHKASPFESTVYTKKEVQELLLLTSDLGFFDRLIMTANSDINDLDIRGSISQLDSIEKQLDRVAVAYSVNFVNVESKRLEIVDQKIIDFHNKDFVSRILAEVDVLFENNDSLFIVKCYQKLSFLFSNAKTQLRKNEMGVYELSNSCKSVLEKLGFDYKIVSPLWNTPLMEYTIRKHSSNALVANNGLVLSKNGKIMVFDFAILEQ